MGRLKARLRQGFIRLGCVIAGYAVAFRVEVALGPGAHALGPLAVFGFIAGMVWISNGFTTDPRRGRALAIRTKRLVMRRALPADLGALHAILSDAETTRYWSTARHAALAETETWLARSLKPEDPLLCDDFVLTHNGRVIGTLGSLRLPWVSFLIDRREWRQGFAGEALAAYSRYMFERGLPYLYAATDARNEAARALLAGAGFREIGRSNGIWLVQGKPSEAVHYRLNADGSEPDLAAERDIIGTMEAALAAALMDGRHGVEQLDRTHADQQPEQQER